VSVTPSASDKLVGWHLVREILGSDAALRERVLWHMLYESSARAEEVLIYSCETPQFTGVEAPGCGEIFAMVRRLCTSMKDWVNGNQGLRQ
jgi:hypothetical protein